ncbi:low molecular weight phosphotyrosine protein phosphatase [Paraburkholderia sp. Tr-20389]|uniref:arsenate reductase/protein-tyrosine-phosphatase family protein n=1 Tax=Paraburkholderia sp. Tr-20389 TaxID=2703903 RepID=UPI00197D7B39|nr:low molecular weight phosphotyrosine protein phosphatase [Paraburkholderia sp. Tr-20389]MBN3758605.1 low molecular weight phosphotyrosine protein phosphatase [Paraburkholderia sp. Tr-20389]
MFANVLIVCHANVCRSPAAEWLFRSRQHGRGAQSIAFRSAGLRAIDGHGMDPVMRRLLEERGVDGGTAGTHRSRRLDRRSVRDADLILVTEQRQVKDVEDLEPTSRGKVYALGKWEACGSADVVDPHGRDEAVYRDSLAHIEHLVMGWLNKIC